MFLLDIKDKCLTLQRLIKRYIGMKFKFSRETQEALSASTGLSYSSLVSEPVGSHTFSNTPDFFSLKSRHQRIIKPRGTVYLFSGRKISLRSVCQKVFGF